MPEKCLGISAFTSWDRDFREGNVDGGEWKNA